MTEQTTSVNTYQHLLEHEVVEHNPRNKPINASVIWLHGLGANGHDFVPVVPELALADDMAVRFIFPHAPSIPVTINAGYVMPAWYDILEISLERKVDEAQILASTQRVIDFIEAEIKKGVASERIIVAGFSQGGAVAYHAALTYPKKLAGLLALSTYIATKELIVASLQQAGSQNASQNQPKNTQLPIFIAHGLHDTVVQPLLAEQAQQFLCEQGLQPDYKTYAVEHGVNIHEIKDIGLWLTKHLA